MSTPRDVVVIGGGINGLVAAFYLARAGRKPLVLERRSAVGGCVGTREIHPGYRSPALSHEAGPLAAQIERDMRLESHGLEWIAAEWRDTALAPDGRTLVLGPDVAHAGDSIRAFSSRDAEAYPRWRSTFERLATALVPLVSRAAPDVDAPVMADLWTLGATARRYRGLGRADAFKLLRWPPMPIADLVSEWFETPLLQAAIAGRATLGLFAGPQEAGTTAALLLAEAMTHAGARERRVPKGGPGRLANAMATAARSAGVEIREGAEVTAILVDAGRARGVRLSNGDVVEVNCVVSGADPKRTLLGLVDPAAIDPEFAWRVGNIRMRGTLAKVNLALDGLPASVTLAPGRIHVGPDLDYLERAFDPAKYGELPEAPWLEAQVPTLADPSLAPSGGHVMSIYVQHVPTTPRGSTWDAARSQLTDLVLRTLSSYMPDLSGRIVGAETLTPADLEREFGLTGGHIHHGEHALDQLHLGRPLLGWAKCRTPVYGLYLCGAGTHPGGGVSGLPGLLSSQAVVTDSSH